MKPLLNFIMRDEAGRVGRMLAGLAGKIGGVCGVDTGSGDYLLPPI